MASSNRMRRMTTATFRFGKSFFQRRLLPVCSRFVEGGKSGRSSTVALAGPANRRASLGRNARPESSTRTKVWIFSAVNASPVTTRPTASSNRVGPPSPEHHRLVHPLGVPHVLAPAAPGAVRRRAAPPRRRPATPNRPQSSALAATSRRTSSIFPRKSFSLARSSAALMVPAGTLALLRAAASWSRASFPRSAEYPTTPGNNLESLGLLGNAAGAGNGAAASLASYSTSGTSTPSRSMTRAHSRNLESSSSSAALVELVRGGGTASPRDVGSELCPSAAARRRRLPGDGPRVRLERRRGREREVGVRVDRHPRDGEDARGARRPGRRSRRLAPRRLCRLHRPLAARVVGARRAFHAVPSGGRARRWPAARGTPLSRRRRRCRWAIESRREAAIESGFAAPPLPGWRDRRYRATRRSSWAACPVSSSPPAARSCAAVRARHPRRRSFRPRRRRRSPNRTTRRCPLRRTA